MKKQQGKRYIIRDTSWWKEKDDEQKVYPVKEIYRRPTRKPVRRKSKPIDMSAFDDITETKKPKP